MNYLRTEAENDPPTHPKTLTQQANCATYPSPMSGPLEPGTRDQSSQHPSSTNSGTMRCYVPLSKWHCCLAGDVLNFRHTVVISPDNLDLSAHHAFDAPGHEIRDHILLRLARTVPVTFAKPWSTSEDRLSGVSPQ